MAEMAQAYADTCPIYHPDELPMFDGYTDGENLYMQGTELLADLPG